MQKPWNRTLGVFALLAVSLNCDPAEETDAEVSARGLQEFSPVDLDEVVVVQLNPSLPHEDASKRMTLIVDVPGTSGETDWSGCFGEYCACGNGDCTKKWIAANCKAGTYDGGLWGSCDKRPK